MKKVIIPFTILFIIIAAALIIIILNDDPQKEDISNNYPSPNILLKENSFELLKNHILENYIKGNSITGYKLISDDNLNLTYKEINAIDTIIVSKDFADDLYKCVIEFSFNANNYKSSSLELHLSVNDQNSNLLVCGYTEIDKSKISQIDYNSLSFYDITSIDVTKYMSLLTIKISIFENVLNSLNAYLKANLNIDIKELNFN